MSTLKKKKKKGESSIGWKFLFSPLGHVGLSLKCSILLAFQLVCPPRLSPLGHVWPSLKGKNLDVLM
jgi:hypothetical protein